MSRHVLKGGGWSLAIVAAIWMIAAAVRGGGAEQAAALPVEALPPPAPVAAPPPPPLSLEAVDAMARELPRLHSLLVSRAGELIFEEYYNGTRRDRLANVKSASKSVISALTGVAIDRGLIPGVGTPIATYFPELARAADPGKLAITVEDLLEMRSGLEGTSNRNYGAWVLSRNWVQHALARPMFAPPGEVMEYSTGNTHLLSAILTKAAGTSTWQLANEVLAEPLGFSLARWPRDPQGIYFGGNDMLMTPRQLLAFGELYLNGGRSGERQIVAESWVARSCEGRERRREARPGRGASDPMSDRQYGYGWWVHDFSGHETCFAWGYGGQYVFVVPDLDVVIVTTSASDVSEERRGHRRTIFDIVDGLLLARMSARS